MEQREEKRFKIEGMHCAGCAANIEKTLSKKKGVHSVSVNFATESGRIEYDGSRLSFGDVDKTIKEMGYRVVREKKRNDARIYLVRFIIALLLSIPVAFSMFLDIHSLIGDQMYLYNMLILILGTIVVLGAGSNFHISFFLKVRRLQFTMDSLISLGALTAYCYSVSAFLTGRPFHHYMEGANFIITFILLGKYLEARSKGKASQALQKLFSMQAKKATVIRDEREELVDIESVAVGELVVVKSGEKVPLDGIIINSGANINESMLTGESLPVFKGKGAEVFAATIVIDGVLTIKVTKALNETVFSRIVDMVEATQSKKPPIQHLADKVSGIFVPSIIGFSFATFLLWFFISGGNLSAAVLPAVAVLVVACPCALGLATPTAIMVATGTGAQHGIIIKDGETFEKSGRIDCVVFDKTGTLTRGKPEVTDVVPISMEKEDLLLANAFSIASNSNHPLSKAIVDFISRSDNTINKMSTITNRTDAMVSGKSMDASISGKFKDVKEVSGEGIEGVDVEQGITVRLGNQRFMKRNAVTWDKEVSEIIDRLSSEGKTTLFFSINNDLAGIFGIMDIPKEDAAWAIRELKRMGKQVYMISGDNKKTVLSIATKLGIEHHNVIAEVLPDEKANKLVELQSKGRKVAFVGDGINDAPALAVADLSVAIGTGSDIAIETGNMVLVKGDPFLLVVALKLSIDTYRIIKQNLFWAFFYNLIGVPLAAFGVLPPTFASLAMSFSSVSVVINSLRIKGIKKNHAPMFKVK